MRDMQDLLVTTSADPSGTHTSPVQARAMMPMILAKGHFLHDLSGTFSVVIQTMHDPQSPIPPNRRFGCWKPISDLQGTLQLVYKKCLSEERQIRHDHHLPIHRSHLLRLTFHASKCGGDRCNVCKKTGWIEIMGAGIVHHVSHEMSGIDASVYSGFALWSWSGNVSLCFVAGINDIRGFYQAMSLLRTSLNKVET